MSFKLIYQCAVAPSKTIPTKNDFKKWLMPLKDTKLLFTFILAVVVVSLGGFWLSLVALKNLHVAVASILNSTEPICVLFLALWINKETITRNDIIGSILAQSGLYAVVPGILLQNSLAITAFASASSVITIHGFVNRITA
jgi:drug/metabolite transporter (DMT)-like permease